MRSVGMLLACMSCAALPGLTAGAAEEAAVPVTKVTAFSSGVAYFEHNGNVVGDAKVLLKFKVDEINDILKSLVLMDLGGGDVGSVSYASRDPVSRALKSFGVDISDEPTLGALLKQVRGAEVLVIAPEKIGGRILGVETKTRHILPSNTIVRQEVLNLLTTEGIKAISLETIASISLVDKKLNDELGKALSLLVESRDSNRKLVQINFAGKGQRAVRIGYIAEAPVWKTSYRLVLGGVGKDQATMQGWAIVENTGDFDWQNVALTLVSGRPISFVQDLYTPLYMPRPVVQPELYASLRPRVYEEGLAVEKARELAEAKREAAARARRAPAAASARPQAPGLRGAYLSGAAQDKAGAADREALQRGVGAVAAAQDVGELFSYRIKAPVSLQRRKSAMLPIINQTVKARKVSIYNASVLARHPLNGVWLINETDLSLLAGPITVFDEGTYAGDASIGNVSPGDKRLLSYAIDLKVAVDSSSSSSQKVVSARIDRGTLHYTRRYTYLQKYLIKNKAQGPRTVLIEHPRSSSRNLVKPAKAIEQTPALYRFEVEVAAGKTEAFEVLEEHVAGQAIAILPTSVGQLQWFASSGEISQEVRDALTKALVMKQKVADLESHLRRLTAQREAIERGQDRLRQNIVTVGKDSTLGKRYVSTLNQQEDQIEALQKQIDGLREQIEQEKKKLSAYLDDLTVR